MLFPFYTFIPQELSSIIFLSSLGILERQMVLEPRDSYMNLYLSLDLLFVVFMKTRVFFIWYYIIRPLIVTDLGP